MKTDLVWFFENVGWEDEGLFKKEAGRLEGSEREGVAASRRLVRRGDCFFLVCVKGCDLRMVWERLLDRSIMSHSRRGHLDGWEGEVEWGVGKG